MRRIEEYWYKFKYSDAAYADGSGADGRASGVWTVIYDVVSAVAEAVILLVLLFSLVFRPASVIGDSMLPTFSNGDRVGCVHSFTGYKYGDVVIISDATKYGEPIIKRVIATAGDTVDINFYSGVVSVNGNELSETYVNTPTNLSFDVSFPVTVPEGCLFVLGDNRNDSKDSRSSEIGFVNENKVLGKVVFRFYPFNRIGIVKN